MSALRDLLIKTAIHYKLLIKDKQLKVLFEESHGIISNTKSQLDLYQVKSNLLGKNGIINFYTKTIASLSDDEKKSYGAQCNLLKNAIQELLDARGQELAQLELNHQFKSEFIDATLPTDGYGFGKIHPISQTIEEIIAIFGAMGFDYADGPQIENDWYNFTALNIPPSHPARQMQDSFYVNKNDEHGNPLVLRTHTSPVQIRALLAKGAPIRVIAPGRTYRSDSDITHTPMFHQVEGIVIDKAINFGHLKGCLHDFCQAYFEVPSVPLRFRPSYFPFTEPSAEVDIGCSRKDGTLKIGEGDSWLEILGSGMVHPNVIRNMGLDPTEFQGFAFGMGIERIAMLKYGIPDLRNFFDSDGDWLNHFGFAPWQNPCLLRSLVP